MITKAQAITLSMFHEPRINRPNAEPNKCYLWRRNGETQTWKRAPRDTHFRVPVKRGLYTFGNITQAEAPYAYAPADCPLCNKDKQTL